MQVTLDIDDDVMETAVKLAERQKRPVDSIISDLARRGMTSEHTEASHDGKRLVALRGQGKPVTPQRISEIQSELDRQDVLKAIGT